VSAHAAQRNAKIVMSFSMIRGRVEAAAEMLDSERKIVSLESYYAEEMPRIRIPRFQRSRLLIVARGGFKVSGAVLDETFLQLFNGREVSGTHQRSMICRCCGVAVASIHSVFSRYFFPAPDSPRSPRKLSFLLCWLHIESPACGSALP
jgi:hypothetical protein